MLNLEYSENFTLSQRENSHIALARVRI